MAKEEASQLNLTVVALVALVAIVGLVALVMNAASIIKAPQVATGSQFATAQGQNAAGEVWYNDWSSTGVAIGTGVEGDACKTSDDCKPPLKCRGTVQSGKTCSYA